MKSLLLGQSSLDRFGAQWSYRSGLHFWKSLLVKPGSRKQSARHDLQTLPPIEINTNQFVQFSVDILRPQVQQHVIKLIRAKVIVFIHFGAPCSSFSSARKADGGPPPLRNRMHLWGFPGLAPRDQAKLQLGHEFMHLTVQWVRLLHAGGFGWSVGNPASSFLWAMPPVVELAALPTAKMFRLDMCRFGSPHKKPTAVLSNVDLREMALLCDQAERPHSHEPLVGTVLHEGQQVFKTRLAQSTHPLCAAFGQRRSPQQAWIFWRLHSRWSHLLLSANARWAKFHGRFTSKGSQLKKPTRLATN